MDSERIRVQLVTCHHCIRFFCKGFLRVPIYFIMRTVFSLATLFHDKNFLRKYKEFFWNGKENEVLNSSENMLIKKFENLTHKPIAMSEIMRTFAAELKTYFNMKTKDELKKIFFDLDFAQKWRFNLSDSYRSSTDYMERKPAKRWIKDAFHWEDTKDGGWYWRQLNDMWEKFCETGNMSIINDYKLRGMDSLGEHKYDLETIILDFD